MRVASSLVTATASQPSARTTSATWARLPRTGTPSISGRGSSEDGRQTPTTRIPHGSFWIRSLS